jgi:copper chaperone
MSTTTFTVKGMTCGHCVNHVTEEVKKIAGVTAVEAGYELVK